MDSYWIWWTHSLSINHSKLKMYMTKLVVRRTNWCEWHTRSSHLDLQSWIFTCVLVTPKILCPFDPTELQAVSSLFFFSFPLPTFFLQSPLCLCKCIFIWTYCAFGYTYTHHYFDHRILRIQYIIVISIYTCE